jgi:hypothetical protein
VYRHIQHKRADGEGFEILGPVVKRGFTLFKKDEKLYRRAVAEIARNCFESRIHFWALKLTKCFFKRIDRYTIK